MGIVLDRSMYFEQAIQEHKKGDLQKALALYQKGFNSGENSPILFQNYGALLRSQGDLENSEKVYLRGIKLHSNYLSIKINLANLYQSTKPTKAIQLYNDVINVKLENQSLDPEFYSALVSIISTLRESGYVHSSTNLLRRYLTVLGPVPSLLIQLIQSIDYFTVDDAFSDSNEFSEFIFDYLRDKMESLSIEERIELCIAVASIRVSSFDYDSSISFYKNARSYVEDLEKQDGVGISDKIIKLVNVLNWNYSNILLKTGQFNLGWSLFDHGLRVAAPGRQRWQRALFKPFDFTQVPLWSGQSLESKHILLLEEQAVGDVMMFLTLISKLIDEVKDGTVSLVLNNRLNPIYRRSFDQLIQQGQLRIFNRPDFAAGNVKHTMFDYQIPLGSIPQYRFSSLTDFDQKIHTSYPLLSDKSLTIKVKEKLLSRGKKPLVGISWRGGAGKSRMAEKSIDIDQFTSLLSEFSHIRFVNLQYGDASSTIEMWRQKGIDVSSITNIDPLKNMDHWLSLVDACDSVLSVANTTIHGSAGLSKPTLCLLSRNPDWRWLIDPDAKTSYWYPTVSIARQNLQGSWLPALDEARAWLRNR